jgi:ribosomal protein S18 acetylase RimI-like enzyme
MRPTNHQPITIRHVLRDDERPLAAQIYYAAFQRKLTPLLGGPTTAVPILERSLEPLAALVALQSGTLVGLVGFHHQRRQLVRWDWSTLVAAFGLRRAIVRYGIALLLARTPRSGELLLDGIAVAPDARGQGVGRQLLGAVAEFGRAYGYRTIALDVVDTNPGARRLYERLGFAAVTTHRYPFMRPFGFTAVTHMRQLVTGELS